MAAEALSLKERLALAVERVGDRWMGPLGIGLYRLTRGRLTTPWKVNVLVLTTRGRRSGKTREVLLQFFWECGIPVVVAANAGRTRHPGWYHNLRAGPAASIQIMGRTVPVRAVVLSPDEARAFWPRVLHVAPTYARYQRATRRTIHLLRLLPTGPAAGRPLPEAAGPPRDESPGTAVGMARALWGRP